MENPPCSIGKYIFKRVIFHCHVRLPEGKVAWFPFCVALRLKGCCGCWPQLHSSYCYTLRNWGFHDPWVSPMFFLLWFFLVGEGRSLRQQNDVFKSPCFGILTWQARKSPLFNRKMHRLTHSWFSIFTHTWFSSFPASPVRFFGGV